ncbi:MAG TPA: hypothetical protein VN725_06285 [Rhodanobacteraceae bacterium]|nr:hypothetical protein [Rhodanobacteraceae bacterium]
MNTRATIVARTHPKDLLKEIAGGGAAAGAQVESLVLTPGVLNASLVLAMVERRSFADLPV